ncbi:hypothetical protein OESDEN_17784 [Oesophagostomum dentatum]|uniref:Uncharacterized protein n=1 Tax=Oesophagostomum dentatum TaxID=61180 RepID=A0A0B1SG64_OESDE|nr:hypothetical protein OESDEN_17784 [Oesophagostomum dentatum]
MHVLVQNKYAEVIKQNGVFRVNTNMKRRLAVRDALEAIYADFLNIPDCSNFPSWDKAIHRLERQFREGFHAMEWRQAVSRFNSCINKC